MQGYPELGEAAFSTAGRRLVTVAAAVELFGGSCMMFIILWRSLQVHPACMPHLVLITMWVPPGGRGPPIQELENLLFCE